MKLEYLDDINDGGRFKEVAAEKMIRLFDFTQEEAKKLAYLIQIEIIANGGELNLAFCEFIEPLNCNIHLSLHTSDEGVLQDAHPGDFVCRLSPNGFTNMVAMINQFTELNGLSGFNWLCDTSAEGIDFLFSPGGTW